MTDPVDISYSGEKTFTSAQALVGWPSFFGGNGFRESDHCVLTQAIVYNQQYSIDYNRNFTQIFLQQSNKTSDTDLDYF